VKSPRPFDFFPSSNIYFFEKNKILLQGKNDSNSPNRFVVKKPDLHCFSTFAAQTYKGKKNY
jgi:hypothetical protein